MARGQGVPLVASVTSHLPHSGWQGVRARNECIRARGRCNVIRIKMLGAIDANHSPRSVLRLDDQD